MTWAGVVLLGAVAFAVDAYSEVVPDDDHGAVLSSIDVDDNVTPVTAGTICLAPRQGGRAVDGALVTCQPASPVDVWRWTTHLEARPRR